MYNESQYDGVVDEPEGITYTMPMWRKIVQGAPASYVHALTAVMLPNTQETLVGTLCTVLQHLEETVESSNAFSRENSDSSYKPKTEREKFYDHSKYEDDYGDCKDRYYRDRSSKQSRLQSRSWSQSRSRSPSITYRRRESPTCKLHNKLWAYLRAQGENIRKWDGETTSKLAARVRELKSKKVYMVNADVLERRQQSPRRRKTEVCFRDDKKASDKPQQRSNGLLQVKDQQVPTATKTVHRWQYQTNRNAVIPIHKMIRKLESQGVVSKTHSPFNSPIWPVRKSDGEWRLTVNYRGLNEITPPLSTAVPDMLELQYKLESKTAKWYATIDVANAFSSIPLAAEGRPQFAFT
ncbi:hypothetical protein BTVI_08141 [Pitangus sulphuratus]|nr:hypothetical protein BTVI_08141 [Pitangus sulphuratus]